MTVQDNTPSPFHAGEVTLQRAVGMAERMDSFGRRVIRDHLPDQHRDFYAELPFLVAAAVDANGDVWPTLLEGRPGFAHSPDPKRLHLAALPQASDPAAEGFASGAAIGLLGIQLETRRRNRLNGSLAAVTPGGFDLLVGHSFGNCPQYIQLRTPRFMRDPALPANAAAEALPALDAEARALIEAADSFFIGSYVDLPGERQVDASHRGGKPGFVRIDADGGFTIPDFAGNFHFNTLGNFLVNPRAGLLFVDFATGDVVQLAGIAQVVTDSPEIAAFQGAERLLRFMPTRIVRRRGALALRFVAMDAGASPNALLTGSWSQAAERIAAEALAKTWRPFRIARIVAETSDISSFHLEPADGMGLARHRAGQHLPVRAVINDDTAPTLRTYTLSSAPSDGGYRISVKRQGKFSAYLHGLEEGDIIEARAPAGAFAIDGTEARAAVLIGAGIGITPMLAMARQIVFEGQRRRGTRPTWLVQAAPSRAARPFNAEIAELVRQADGALRFIAVHDAPAPDERQGVDHSWSGRFAAADLSRFLPFGDYDFYLCGPPGFMQAVYDGLRALNVADDRIHAEAFGPSSLTRSTPVATEVAGPKPATGSVPVLFAASAKEARWEPGSGTLLELAEARGLSPDSSCRGGSCGACAVKLKRGSVVYPRPVSAAVAPGEMLLCSAVPAEGSDALEIEA